MNPARNTSSSRAAEGPFKTGKVLILSSCHFIHDIYSSFLAPLLPFLIEKLSMTLAQAGFLSTVMQIPSLLNPLIGLVADRRSVRYFIIFAPATTAIPMSLAGLAPNYGVLLVLFFITGVSVAVFHVPAPVMIAHLSGDRKGRGMSLYMTGGELARTIGPLVAVGAVSFFGLQGFYPIMIFGITASAWLYFRFRDVPVHGSGSDRVSLRGTWLEVRHVLLPLTAILIARGFMHASMTTFLPTFMKQETGNMWIAGVALSVLEGTGVVAVLCSGTLSDYIGRRKILFFALTAAPFCLLFFVWTGGPLRYVMLIATGFSLLSTMPVMLVMVQEHAVTSPSAANGLLMMVSFVARSVIVAVVGMIADRIGLRDTYLISAGIGFLGIPFILMLPRGNGPGKEKAA